MKLTIDGCKNIIPNKYFVWYKNIIISNIETQKHNIKYLETHHILPKSMGGSNSNINLVKLTPREHYIVHLCLTKCTKGNAQYKMLKAFLSMCMVSDTHSTRYINNRSFSVIREKLSDATREYMLKHSPFKNPKIHKKCMLTRKENGTNIFVTNNPMKNPDSLAKKVEKTKGANHYLTKRFSYKFSYDNGITWTYINKGLTVSEICKHYNWKVSTFNYILYKGKQTKRGNMAGVLIIQELNNED